MKRIWCVTVIMSAVALAGGRAQSPGNAGTSEEARLIELLQSDRPPAEKDAACARLHQIGTDRAIPALAALLDDPHTSHSARHALESMSSPAAGRALVDALGRTAGVERLGIVGSLGVRREQEAVAALVRLFAQARSDAAHMDAATANEAVALAVAAADALGGIDAPEAIAALEAAWRESRGPIRRSVVDALLRQANSRLAAGNRTGARRLFAQLHDRETDERLRLASFQGLIRASGDDGLRLLVDALAGPSRTAQQAALGVVPELPVVVTSAAFAKLLPTLSSPLQVALLETWMQRPEPPGVAALTPLLGSSSPEVRISAIRALGRVGDGSVVAPLIEAAAVRGAEQDAARLALTQMTAADVPVRLLGYLDSVEPDMMFEAARILAERGEKRAVPPLLRKARDESPRVRQATLRGLVLLLDESQIGELVRLVAEARDEGARAEAARAVALAYERVAPAAGSPSLVPLLNQLAHGTPAIRIALLPATRPLALAEIRTAVRAAIADRDADVRAAGIRAACRSTDAELLPDLAAIAARSPDDEFREVATKACVRHLLADGNGVSTTKRVEVFRGLAASAANTAQKRALLAGLSRGSTLAELELARSLVTESALRTEAMEAVLSVALRVGESGPALAILRDVRSVATDAETAGRIDAAVKQIEPRMAFVTSWRSAEFSRIIDRTAAPLIDTPFGPEQELANLRVAAVRTRLANWQPMAAGTNSSRPMQLRGGGPTNFTATYAYTWLKADYAQAVELVLEHDAPIKLWLNGQPVIFGAAGERQRRGQAGRARVTLEPGANLLLLKIAEPGRAWSFSARVTNPDGSPSTDVVADASLEPDA